MKQTCNFLYAVLLSLVLMSVSLIPSMGRTNIYADTMESTETTETTPKKRLRKQAVLWYDYKV